MIFSISTNKKHELIDITDKVNEIVKKSGFKQGICHIYALHATASIVVIESYDPNICLDFLDALNRTYPDLAGYRHDRIDGNAGAHIKAALLGPGETVPFKDSQLLLGTWQAINLVELDGPKRSRKINVELIDSK